MVKTGQNRSKMLKMPKTGCVSKVGPFCGHSGVLWAPPAKAPHPVHAFSGQKTYILTLLKGSPRYAFHNLPCGTFAANEAWTRLGRRPPTVPGHHPLPFKRVKIHVFWPEKAWTGCGALAGGPKDSRMATKGPHFGHTSGFGHFKHF